jgi:hypothetical protein
MRAGMPRIAGVAKSPHAMMNENTAAAVRLGVTRGSVTRVTIRQREAPATRAASS